MATVAAPLSIKEYLALPDTGIKTELVRGKIIEVPPPNFFHGIVCGEITYLLKAAVKRQGSGRITANDSGVVTEHNPDSLRGPDVAYFSAARTPPIDRWKGYPDQSPELVVEIRSPSNRWSEMVQKALEYLAAGVLVVVILDTDTRSAHIFQDDQPPRALGPEDTLTFPGILDGFAVVVGRIFE